MKLIASRRRAVQGSMRLLPIVVVLFLVSILLPLGIMDNAPADSGDPIQPSIKDTFVSEFQPTINFNGDPGHLIVRYGGSGFPYHIRTFVEFSLASIPFGSTIDGAEFGLYIDANIQNTDFKVMARRILSSWTENGVTWNNQPSSRTVGSVVIDTGTADSGWLEWNITAFVDDWVNQGILNAGIQLRWVSGGASQGEIRFFDREYATASERPRLIVYYTPPEDVVPSYLVYLAGGIDNITSWVGATSTEFNVRVENVGNVELTSVVLELYSHVPALVAETELFNIEIDEIRNHQFIHTHGLAAGTYTGWQFQAHYQGDIAYWNFTLYVDSDPLPQIFFASSDIQPKQIDTDNTATVSVSINNVGGMIVALRIQATSISLIVSPTTAQQIILQSGTGQTVEFILYPQETGYFYVDVLVTPINQTTGVAIGASFFDRHLLRVTEASSVTTFSADDIGISDAILNGKINSLGGFSSVTVYFTFWATGEGIDSARVLPPNKQVVSFVSDFRVWVGGLVPETQYAYEFRMAVGPVASRLIYYGGIVNFTTTVVFADPITAARNGMAEFFGIDSIIMGIILGSMFVVFAILGVSYAIGERLEGMAQSLAIGITGFIVSAIFLSVGYFPLWILAFLAVLMATIIIGLPTFQKGVPSE